MRPVLRAAFALLLSVVSACDRPETTAGPLPPVSLAPAVTETPPPEFAPYVVDPGQAGHVTAKWLRYAGMPDEGGVPAHAVLLQLEEGAQPGAEAGIRITNVKGLSVPESIGLDFQSGGPCDKDALQLELTTSDDKVLTLDCASGEQQPSPVKGAKGWTRVTWVLPVPSLPSVSVLDLRIIVRLHEVPFYSLIGRVIGIEVIPRWPGLRVFVAEAALDQIIQISDNFSTRYFGRSGSVSGHFRRPMDVFVDAEARIYVADMDNNRVVRIDDMSGAGWTAAAGPPVCIGAAPAAICEPVSVYVDGAGLIYTRDVLGRAYRFNMAGGALTPLINFNTAPPLNSEQDVFLDPKGRIYTTDPHLPNINRFDNLAGAGRTRFSIFGSPWHGVPSANQHLFIDRSGQIFFTDQCRIFRTSDIPPPSGPTGVTAYPGGGLCFPSGRSLTGPTSVGTDHYGRIYFTASNRVYRMNDMTGAGLIEIAVFSSPVTGIWVDDREPPPPPPVCALTKSTVAVPCGSG